MDFDTCEREVRRVLAKQLNLRNLKIDDNLIKIDPEFPEDDVLMDVFEEFRFNWVSPVYDEWDGTLRGLVVIAQSNLNRLEALRHHPGCEGSANGDTA